MIAALPMYDWPELRPATDALWEALAHECRLRGLAAPATLTRAENYHAPWHDPALLLGQSCGYPLVSELVGVVQLVGTPIYAAAGCNGPQYSSALVVRADDPAADLAALAGRRFTYNSVDSQSGWWAMAHSLRQAGLPPIERFFGSLGQSHSHRNSLRLVAHGAADVAAIDAVCWALSGDLGQQAGLRVLGWTEPTPGLPLITSATQPPTVLAKLRAAIEAVMADPALAAVRGRLRLAGFVPTTLADYAVIATRASLR